MFKRKLLKWLFRSDPELCADVFCEDFVGLVAKRSMDNNALRFLQKNSGQMEPWLLWMNHQLQKEQAMYGQKLRGPGFYEGAMFILKLLYVKTCRYVPKKSYDLPGTKNINDPAKEVLAFTQGIREKYAQESRTKTKADEVQFASEDKNSQNSESPQSAEAEYGTETTEV